MKIASEKLSGKRVLVTGGTGFIGSRLVERLVLDCNAVVRVLVRSFARAPRISRFPIEMVRGDVTVADDVERAVSGCEIVFHCAYGNQGGNEIQRLVNVEGTRNVLAAAQRAGVMRVVHLSTLMVYGATADGDLDETAPRRYFGHVYADSKLDAEKIGFGYGKNFGLPLVVLQPTAVYGPFAPLWTTSVLEQLMRQRLILINEGHGLCNAVYVDDVVSAILLGAVEEKAVGEAFLISGEYPVTWRDFYGVYERMLGISGTVSMSAAEAEAYWKQQNAKGILREALQILRENPAIRSRILETTEVATVRKVVRLILSDQNRQSLKRLIDANGRRSSRPLASEENRPIRPLHPLLVRFYGAKTRVRIDKAKQILGYHPAYNFESGMRLTEQWARWAGLLDMK